MNREKPENVGDNLEDLEFREKISDVLNSIRNDRDYNPEDIDEEKITSTLVDQFKALVEDHIAKEGFLLTLEQQIKIMIAKKAEERINRRVSNTMKEFRKIEERIHGKGKDKNKPEIPQAA